VNLVLGQFNLHHIPTTSSPKIKFSIIVPGLPNGLLFQFFSNKILHAFFFTCASSLVHLIVDSVIVLVSAEYATDYMEESPFGEGNSHSYSLLRRLLWKSKLAIGPCPELHASSPQLVTLFH
jgi:hypothetical protein